MRGSPDGRYIAYGNDTGDGTILDLSRDVAMDVPFGQYDPDFFPDGSGFAFQPGGIVCDARLLTATPPPTSIDLSDPACNAMGIGQYQQLGRALNGGDYWTAYGVFASDQGMNHSDPFTGFPSDTVLHLLPLLYDGNTYQAGTVVDVTEPYEGDTTMSPSATMLVSRISGTSGQAGYRVRAMNATPSGSTYNVDTPELGTYCASGGKAVISYDERFVVFHHTILEEDAAEYGFSDVADPDFQDNYLRKRSDIFLIDLLTGERTRITSVGRDEWALFPNFRSDGWIYFLVRKGLSVPEYIVASDAMLVVAGQ
jgi:hypothetical protein